MLVCVLLCRWSVRRALGRTDCIHRCINIRVSLLQKENEPHRSGKNPWSTIRLPGPISESHGKNYYAESLEIYVVK